MVAIEDNGTIQFSHKGKELTMRQGFNYLDKIYANEPPETRKVIDRLKERYMKDLLG
jgi:hypothetical protein